MKKYYLARRREDHEPLFIIPTFKTLDEYKENLHGFVFQELKESEAETYIEFGSLPVSNIWYILTDLADNDGVFNHTKI